MFERVGMHNEIPGTIGKRQLHHIKLRERDESMTGQSREERRERTRLVDFQNSEISRVWTLYKPPEQSVPIPCSQESLRQRHRAQVCPTCFALKALLKIDVFDLFRRYLPSIDKFVP